MSAEAEIKQFIDRILRLKEEQDTLSEDIREVYAEAKGRGYDKTVLGNVVSHLRKVEKLGRDTLNEREAIFDLYLTAYETGGRAPASARTRESIEEFPVNARLVATVANAVQTEAGRAALITAVDIMIEREERIDPDTGEIFDDIGEGQESPSSERIPDGPVAAANAGGVHVDRSAVRASSVVEVGATNSPETANEMDRDVLSGGKSAHAVPAENARKAIPAVGYTLPEDGTVNHAGADESSATNSETSPDPHTPAADDGQPGIHSSSPASAKSDGLPSIAGQVRESGVNHTGSKEAQAVDQFTPPAFLHKPVNLRPDCQHPSACAGYGSHQCHACTKAAQEVAA
jgi:uncharacterized protein (UPF0335 family)